MLTTIVKAGRVLDLFTTSTAEWGVSATAERLRIPKSSAHDLLATLAEIGLLRRLADGRYRLGWRLAELNRTLADSTAFIVHTRDCTQPLADRLRATIHVAALREHKVVYLDKAVGVQTPDLTPTDVGGSAPVHCTALGKVLLAELDAEAADALISRTGMARWTSQTITKPIRMQEELVTTRMRGWASDLEETVTRLCCVAAPIRDNSGRVQGAISASVPLTQFRQHRHLLQRNITTAASGLSRLTRQLPPLPRYGVEGSNESEEIHVRR
jgi:IclR family transcriptional regulator, KDG regulon repressor